MPRSLRAALAALLLLALVVASVRRLGSLPRLGPFLDPVRGVWAVAAAAEPSREETAALPGLAAPVTVVFDDRAVPHIFAATEDDAYRVLGYVVARDRLFQLDLQTRATAGTLTGLLGPRALEADRASRAAGLADAAERKYARLDTASIGYRAIVAYAEGVNAWIDRLGEADLPLEYRLLGARPSRWEPKYTFYLFGRMGQTLASSDPGLLKEELRALVGDEAAEAIVAVNSQIQEPIQPNGAAIPREEFAPLPPPGRPDSARARALLALRATLDASPRDLGALGSNNWAVSPSRSASGAALLAGDPHLQLTLPSIWYEVHINVPGAVDVAGVSLPGAPGVVIGFNRDVAWTFTNTGGDVLDFYRETVDDSVAPTRYQLDGSWRDLRIRVETYRDPQGNTLATDTIRSTHRGPMQRLGGEWISRRWTVLEPSAENDVFLHLARASSADQWLTWMEEYVAPTQNGLVADRTGTIAIRSSGWFPIRPGDGRGDRLFDGSASASDWLGALPVEQYPFAYRPAQGFLVSANQQPVDPAANPAYLGGDWPAPWRAININRLLRADSAVTPEKMRRMQTDPGSARAEALVPFFLAAAESSTRADRPDEALRRAADLLREWDRRYDPANRRAILFELAIEETYRRALDELIPPDTARRNPVYRNTQLLLGLLRDSSSTWWDDRRTPDVREERDQVLAASLRAALDTARARYGPPEGEGWRWGTVWPTDIWHFLRLPSLSALNLPVSGGPETIAPAGRHGGFGASWRMVVELGPELRAWATYPGGQSGNPASRFYTDRVRQWTAGDLDPILFPRSPTDLPADRVRATLTVTPGR
ncbi:MAG TPA: penicillin acylase family protein [Gemmatimonadales bacterium]